MKTALEQCGGTIKDGLCMKCFNRAMSSSSICIQMYEVEIREPGNEAKKGEEPEFAKVVIIENKVSRRYTEEWRKSGTVDIDKIPDWVTAIISQHKFMVRYIEDLHDKIDELLATNPLK